MAKIINITDKLNLEKPSIQIGEKLYPVNDSMETVLKFEELAVAATKDAMGQAIVLALGDEAAKELNATSYSIPNFKVLTTALLAAMQGMDYEEAEARFQKAEHRINQ